MYPLLPHATHACHLGMIDRWAGVVLSSGSVEQRFNCPKCVFDLPCVDQKHSRESQPAPGAKASTDNIEQRWVRYVKRSHAPLRTPWGSNTVLNPVRSRNLPLWETETTTTCLIIHLLTPHLHNCTDCSDRIMNRIKNYISLFSTYVF